MAGKRLRLVELAAQQRGWLDATPSFTVGGKTTRWEHSRRHQLEKVQHVPLDVVFIPDAQYLIDACEDAGFVGQGPEGMIVPLTWGEIRDYLSVIDAVSTEWEARMLRKISIAYVDGYRHGAHPASISPVQLALNSPDD